MLAKLSSKAFILMGASGFLTRCQADKASPQDIFFQDLSEHCGKAYAGKLVSTDAADASFSTKTLTLHVRDCSDKVIRIPFHVDDDRSRTWVISRTQQGMRLRHDHRHEDGSEDAVTQYGGDTVQAGTTSRQSFPVDNASIDMFKAEGLAASVVNVWNVEINDTYFAYELTRPDRLFRVEFDLSKPLSELPPPPWGFE